MNPDLQSAVRGISLADEELRNMQLPELKPRPDALAGDPREADFDAYVEGDTSVGVWECTPGRFPGKKEGINEMMHLLAGRATITDEDGTVHELAAGSMFIVMDGWRGVWEVHETVRKVYAIWPTR